MKCSKSCIIVKLCNGRLNFNQKSEVKKTATGITTLSQFYGTPTPRLFPLTQFVRFHHLAVAM